MNKFNPKLKFSRLLPLIIIGKMAVLTLTTWANEPTANVGAANPSAQEEVLNNASIIELKELGLGESLIIEKIKISQSDFDVTIAGLKQLKAAAVPNPS